MILSVCPNPSIDCYAWLEDFHPGEVNRISNLQEFPGGKGVHVAMAVAELGGESGLLGSWAGGTGDWIKSKCRERNIQVSGIELEGNNRKCYTLRSSNAAISNTEILEPGPTMKDQDWQEFRYTYEKALETATIVCFSGSWPNSAPEDAYNQLIQIAKKKNKKIILDCSGNQLKQALKSSFFGLHLNELEAYNLCGSTDFNVLLKELIGRVELVALTKGKEGLWMAYKGKTFIANVEIDKVISTVGSGDCLTAGIAWSVSRDLLPQEIAAYGVACGAANCLNEDLGILKKKDVENLFPKVKCKIVEHEY